MPNARFPQPWTVEEYRGISYIVRDANRFAVAHIYFASDPSHTRYLMSKDEARIIAVTIARVPEMVMRLQSAANDHNCEGPSTSERIARLAELAKRLCTRRLRPTRRLGPMAEKVSRHAR
jgi:hypothetical protein